MDQMEFINDDLPRYFEYDITSLLRVCLCFSTLTNKVDAILEDIFGRVHTIYMREYLNCCKSYSSEKILELCGLLDTPLVNFDSEIETGDEIIAAHDDCPICKLNFWMPVRLACKHIFCKKCIARWLLLYNTCPYCRTRVY